MSSFGEMENRYAKELGHELKNEQQAIFSLFMAVRGGGNELQNNIDRIHTKLALLKESRGKYRQWGLWEEGDDQQLVDWERDVEEIKSRNH